MNEAWLNSRFPLRGLRFSVGRGGLIRAEIETPVAKGEVYLHGAHVTQYHPAGFDPVLWLSEQSSFETGKPIRGGIPICFPWFGPHPSDSTAPAHGWARLRQWDVVACSYLAEGGIGIEFSTTEDDVRLNYQVEFGATLRIFLRVELASTATKNSRFEEALHTYFSVGDVREVSIEGVESSPYLDKVGGLQERLAEGRSLRFAGETDRVYRDTISTCALRDEKWKRTITVRKAGSRSTVIWNPWIDKSQRMADFGDQEWPGMVCIETANVGANAIELPPGSLHILKAEIIPSVT